MSKFLQLCFASFAVVAAVVFEASANEAAISDDYYYDYDLYSYDDVVDALYSDQGITYAHPESDKRLYWELIAAEALLPSESRQRPQKRKKRPKGQKRQKQQQEFAKENRQVSAKELKVTSRTWWPFRPEWGPKGNGSRPQRKAKFR